MNGGQEVELEVDAWLYVALSRSTDPDNLWLADDGAGSDLDGNGLTCAVPAGPPGRLIE